MNLFFPPRIGIPEIGFSLFVPAARALAVVAGTRVPDTFVRHDCGVCDDWESSIVEGGGARKKG